MSVIEQVLATQSAIAKAEPALASLKKSTDGMEAAFLKQIVSSMRKSTGDIHFGKELGGDTYREMFDQTIADTMAEKGTAGLSKAMFAAMAPQVLNHKVSTNTALTRTASKDSEDHI